MTKLGPFSALAPEQVWEFDPAYYRKDRISIVQKLPGGGFWQTKEIKSGDVRNYTQAEIHRLAVPTLVQPGQIWDSLRGQGEIIIQWCKSGHSFLVGGAPSWSWEFSNRSTGRMDVREESILIRDFALVDLSVSAPPPRQSNGPCPRCGNPALTLAQWVECGNKQCPNYKPWP